MEIGLTSGTAVLQEWDMEWSFKLTGRRIAGDYRKETNADAREQTTRRAENHLRVRKINGGLTKITNTTNPQRSSVQALSYL